MSKITIILITKPTWSKHHEWQFSANNSRNLTKQCAAKNQSERREAFKNKNTPKKKQQNCNWKKPTNCAHLSKKRIFLESMLNNFKQQKKRRKETHTHTHWTTTHFLSVKDRISLKRKTKKGLKREKRKPIEVEYKQTSFAIFYETNSKKTSKERRSRVI